MLQLGSFSARRKSGPKTAEDLLGSMWNAVRSNNGIMVRYDAVHFASFCHLHLIHCRSTA